MEFLVHISSHTRQQQQQLGKGTVNTLSSWCIRERLRLLAFSLYLFRAFVMLRRRVCVMCRSNSILFQKFMCEDCEDSKMGMKNFLFSHWQTFNFANIFLISLRSFLFSLRQLCFDAFTFVLLVVCEKQQQHNVKLITRDSWWNWHELLSRDVDCTISFFFFWRAGRIVTFRRCASSSTVTRFRAWKQENCVVSRTPTLSLFFETSNIVITWWA